MIRIVASSHYFRRLSEGETLEPLDARVNALCRERYRRIDRFVQLALIGAAECVRGKALAPDCGLYLASAIGSIGSNVQLQDAIVHERKLPMPFSFVNTLGSSACFHVAKDQGLSGEAILVARDHGSFSAALGCAIADLSSGIVTHMLIGAIEECLLPGRRQRSLLRQDESVAIAEGSHWLLVESARVDGVQVADAELHDAAYDGYEAVDAACITGFLDRNHNAQFGLTLANERTPKLIRMQ